MIHRLYSLPLVGVLVAIVAACHPAASVANDYYTATTVSRHTLARASAENSDRAAVEAAFDKLPSLNDLVRSSGSYGADTGAADAYVVALNKTLTAYSDGALVVMKVGAGNTNTGASTINVDSLGARSIKLQNGNDPAAGAIPAGGIIELRYDGTNFQIVSEALSTTEVFDDKSPKLGGDLDINNKNFTNSAGSNFIFAGNVITTGQLQVDSDIYDRQDTTLNIKFNDTSDEITLRSGPGTVERLSINNSGVRFGAANARVTTILDEDAMGSDSATALATQQSIKAYVDSMWNVETAKTLSSGATSDFTGLRATIKEIVVDLAQVSTTGTSPLTLEIGTGSTSWASSGYDTVANNGSGGATGDTTAIALTGTIAAVDSISGQIRIRRVSGNEFTVMGTTHRGTASGSYFVAGRFTLGAELTGVRLTTVGGSDTFDAGTYALEHRIER